MTPPAVFLFESENRTDMVTRVPVIHGDLLVWGGPARLYYQGVTPLKDGRHPLAGGNRFNLTLRTVCTACRRAVAFSPRLPRGRRASPF